MPSSYRTSGDITTARPKRLAMLLALLTFFMAAPPVVAADLDEELAVRRLVRQLDAPQLAQREAAEAALLGLGPTALDLLPTPSDRMSPEVRLRLARVRQKLQQTASASVVEPSRITLKAEAMRLSDILAALEDQSGNRLIDARRPFGQQITDPALAIDFDKTPFWKALDTVLDRAGLTVYPYGQKETIRIVARSPGATPRAARAHYAGPFRFEPLLIRQHRDLRNPSGNVMQVEMQISWEPRIRPITLTQPLGEVRAVDEAGRPIPVENPEAELEAPIESDTAAVEMTLPFALPPPEAQAVATLAGTLSAMIPGRIETFRFDDLRTARNVRKRAAGVTATLEQIRRHGDLLEFWMSVRYDDPHGALASHRGWILRNAAYLQTADGKRIERASLHITRRTEQEIGLIHGFRLDDLPDGAAFVYQTPGAIFLSQFDYRFENLRLP